MPRHDVDKINQVIAQLLTCLRGSLQRPMNIECVTSNNLLQQRQSMWLHVAPLQGQQFNTRTLQDLEVLTAEGRKLPLG